MESDFDWNTKQLSQPKPYYSYTYDSTGRVYEKKFEQSGTMSWIERYVYDATGATVYHLNALTDPFDSTHIDKVYRYDSKGRLVMEGNPRKKYREYAYDSTGNKIMQRDMSTYMPNVELERQDFAYDAQGHLVKYTLAHKGKFGSEATHSYNAAGQMVSTAYRYSTSSDVTKYRYDANGLKTLQASYVNNAMTWMMKYVYTYYP